MIAMFALAAVVSLPCEKMPEPQSTQCGLARQQFICWTTESRNIRDDDPALLLFWTRGKPISEAKFRLAYERNNGCDPEVKP